MAFAPTLKTWLLVLPAVAVLGVAGYRASGHAGSVPVTAGELPTARVAADDAASLPVVPEALARRLAAFERGNGLPSGLPLDLRADIEDATDLYAYAQRLRVQADEGNHEARWMLSRVYDYCAQYAIDPGGYRLDNNVLAGLGLTAAPAMVQARERVAQRCGGFVPGDKLGSALVLAERRKAATQGNLAAEASLFAEGEPLHDSPEYRRDLVERVRTSRDPEAFMAIAPGMGVRAAGTRRSLAWWRENSSVNWHGGLRPANSVYRVVPTVCWSTVFVRMEGSVRRMGRRISGISCMTLRFRGKVRGK